MPLKKQKYYITTTLPYVNAEPHIGFALEIIQADVLARFHHLSGEEVVFNTGTDEHGMKIYRKALEQKKEPLAYCDEYAARFDALKRALDLSYTNFIRTTDPHHIKAAQEFWMLCYKNGDIYKKNYQVKYCVGCEMEKTDSELMDGRCPIHPKMELEQIEEENYFFKFSKYQKKLLDIYEKNPKFVIPKNRLREIKNFVESCLQDFSISRLKSKMPWGIEVPNDSEHVMYVWFDALINYISTIGWPDDMKKYNSLWPGLQVAGKDNLRQQSAMWQAMLLSAGLKPSKQIFIHGFITSRGQKMSKSLGNVVDPFEIVNKYGTDATRYYLLGAMPAYEDGDFTVENFEKFYTAHLANGVGNLTSRILTMLEKYSDGKVPPKSEAFFEVKKFWQEYEDALEEFAFDKIIIAINELVSKCDELISEQKPWEKAKKGEDITELLYQLAEGLRHIGISLLPIMPRTAERILNGLNIRTEDVVDLKKEIKWGGLKSGVDVKKGEMLFPRI
ncbi:MAG: methionine--tRNA ligase [Patescibacteria group bacterium]|nr:methionine--tRNA ligase [Patescibacteria group bacterium]